MESNEFANRMSEAHADATTPSKGKRNPPRNPIIGQARADEWDRKIDGIIFDLDILAEKQSTMTLNQEVNRTVIQSALKWILIRDIIIILLLVMMGGLVGFNTMQLWGWG